jgi:hypothetical protein
MKIASPMSILFAGLLAGGALVIGASGDISGTWNTASKPRSTRLVMVYEPTFEFKVNGDKLSGVAHVAGWPGDGTISDGKVVGDRITFTVTHEQPYTTNGNPYYPSYRCTGTVHGDELDLTMVQAERSTPNPVTLELKGTRARE